MNAWLYLVQTKMEGVMKKSAALFIALLGLMLVSCILSDKYMTKATAPEGPTPGKALVFFMQPNYPGSVVHQFKIWEEYKLIGISRFKSYFSFECDPGRHYFVSNAHYPQVVEADLEADKTYFILIQQIMDPWPWHTSIQFIPVIRGSEYWDKVDRYKQKLKYEVIQQAAANDWESESRGEIITELNEIISYAKTTEGQNRMVVRLEMEDGR
jgi:hypothetical protein